MTRGDSQQRDSRPLWLPPPLLVQGRFESGEDIAALRRFVDLTQAEFARAIGISVHTDCKAVELW